MPGPTRTPATRPKRTRKPRASALPEMVAIYMATSPSDGVEGSYAYTCTHLNAQDFAQSVLNDWDPSGADAGVVFVFNLRDADKFAVELVVKVVPVELMH